jgi:hypothetical protein
MNKSAQSCIWSIRSLLAEKKVAYLWTFTFRNRLEIADACGRWQDLQRDLVRSVGFQGVRVYELHPGGHGLHIHVITSGRHDVRAVRYYAESAGFGRIHVKPVPSEGADYIAKYLTKARRSNELKGRRLWACLGFKGAKVRDCEIDSPLTREIKKISTDEVCEYLRRTNCSVPSSPQSINFFKYTFARLRLSQRSLRYFMLKIPEVSKPDLAAIEQADIDFVDRVIAWMDRRAVEKNEREGVPF